MRDGSWRGWAMAAVASALIFQASNPALSLGGDEPGRLGRLFRIGGASPASSSAKPPGTAVTPTSPSQAISNYYGQPPALSTPPASAVGPTLPPIKPKPRITRPATEADPLVTRISLGRSDEGTQFGMLLQIFADGTVIDGQGVHKIGPDALKPLIEAVGSGELAKLKGHCGGSAGDFIETNHVVVFDRAYGRLRASSFSYAGNADGCEHSVHHLQKLLEDIQTRVTSGAPGVAPAQASASVAPIVNPHLAMPGLPATSTP